MPLVETRQPSSFSIEAVARDLLINPGPRSTAGWALFAGGSPVPVNQVRVTTGGLVRITRNGSGPVDRLRYNGLDASIENNRNEPLEGFDRPVPWAS